MIGNMELLKVVMNAVAGMDLEAVGREVQKDPASFAADVKKGNKESTQLALIGLAALAAIEVVERHVKALESIDDRLAQLVELKIHEAEMDALSKSKFRSGE